MKATLLILAVLTSFVALTAEAKKKPHLPEELEKIGKSKLIAIDDLRTFTRTQVNLLIARSNFNDVYDSNDERVIATVDHGDVDKAPYFPHTKSLNDDMVQYLSHSRTCDLDLDGPCLVYTKKDGKGHATVIATRRFSSGKTFVLQGAFMREGRGSTDIDTITDFLKQKSDSKYVIFTNAPAANEVPDYRPNEERRLRYETDSRFSTYRSSRRVN